MDSAACTEFKTWAISPYNWKKYVGGGPLHLHILLLAQLVQFWSISKYEAYGYLSTAIRLLSKFLKSNTDMNDLLAWLMFWGSNLNFIWNINVPRIWLNIHWYSEQSLFLSPFLVCILYFHAQYHLQLFSIPDHNLHL